MSAEEFDETLFNMLEVYHLSGGDVILKKNKPPKVYCLVLKGQVLEMNSKTIFDISQFVLNKQKDESKSSSSSNNDSNSESMIDNTNEDSKSKIS